MAQSHQQTENQGGHPDGFETIYTGIGEKQMAMVRELSSGSPCDVKSLSREDRADIPSGSISHHISWLRGEDRHDRKLPWWPEEVGPLLEVVDRIRTPGGGHPTRVVQLTETGRDFLQFVRNEKDPAPNPDTHPEQGMALDSHEERIQELTEKVKNLGETVEELSQTERGQDGEDGDGEESQRVEELEERVDMQETLVQEALNRLDKHGLLDE